MAEQQQITITYQFILSSKRELKYQIELDQDTLELKNPNTDQLPEWTRLDYEPRCKSCSLFDSDQKYCPLAVNLCGLVNLFKDIDSYEVVDCRVTTRERIYTKEQISIQSALSSLIGIIMTTSGCEHLDYLRPMVKFHLPFASIEETIYRAASMYLLAQYFKSKHDMDHDLSLTGLADIYENIDNVNAQLCHRIRNATNKDASLNAVVVLDVFAKMVPMSIEETLQVFEPLFGKYWNNNYTSGR